MRLGKILLLSLCSWGAWQWYHSRPLPNLTPGIAAAAAPIQDSTSKPEFVFGKYKITPLAHFNIKARVLAREDYRLDYEADLSPTDLALGWGRMSDPSVYHQLSISQGNRFYYWHYDDTPPIPETEIIRSSANMHLIPSDAQIKSQIDQVRVGQIVSIQGFLVQAHDSSGRTWRSSLSREDSGAGACEVIWVESFSTITHAAENTLPRP